MSDPTIFTYTVRDELGTEASTLVYANYNGTLETVDGLVGEWLAYGGLIDAATSGQIVGGAIKIPATPDGSWKTAPAAGSRVEQTALLNFHPTGSNKRQGSTSQRLSTLPSQREKSLRLLGRSTTSSPQFWRASRTVISPTISRKRLGVLPMRR